MLFVRDGTETAGYQCSRCRSGMTREIGKRLHLLHPVTFSEIFRNFRDFGTTTSDCQPHCSVVHFKYRRAYLL